MIRGSRSETANSTLKEAPELQARQSQPEFEELPLEQLQALYQRYNGSVYNFFANYGCTREECRDLVQDTFLEAHRSATSFRGDSNAQTWIFAIAKNVFLQTLRNRSRLKRHAEHLPIDQLSEKDRQNASHDEHLDKPLDNLITEEKQRLLRQAMADLPERMRLCVFLYFVQGRVSSEIAALLRIAEGTVRSQLAQARERLKKRLAEHFPDIL
jgi:RNA polymerase sigma-70 factor (ECF subfamily)